MTSSGAEPPRGTDEVAAVPARHAVVEPGADEATALRDAAWVNETGFFRDRDAFESLERELKAVVLEPLSSRGEVRAWVAGCATGEEAYSIAMLLAECAASAPRSPEVQVFASDTDRAAIAVASAGSYPLAIGADVTPRRMAEFFTREGDRYRVDKPTRERVRFAAHNVLRDPPYARLDLVSCRNLLFHLDREAQQQVFQAFASALQPGGLLFLGEAESAVSVPELFSVVDERHHIYRASGRQPTAPAPPAATRADAEFTPAPAAELGRVQTRPVPNLPPTEPTAELRSANARLEAVITASQSSADDLAASNAELRAVNQALRSATEALERSRLDLLSANRELMGFNRELERRLEESGARRRAERSLHQGELRMRLVAQSTSDYAIITADTDGIVTSWNTGAELLFGYAPAEIIGQPCDLIFTPEDRAAEVPASEMRRARQLGRALDERWHLRKDGSRFYCSGIMTPLQDEVFHGYAKIARDLTEVKRAETQREQLLASEQQLRSQLQDASVLKDEFLAVMSHELKHPLNLIHVNAELLTRMPEVREAPAVARAANVIRRTVLSQAKIIDDLLDLSRLHTGKLSLNFAPLQWSAVIERVVEAAHSDAVAKNLDLRTALDPRASTVVADALRVEQIAWNLLSNALKFTPEGGRVVISLAPDGDFARLDVTDSGQGIEPAFLPHVFDMFRQADSRTTRQEGGLGIGLALVKHLAELQGGRVDVDSAGRGRGARFSVWLPRSGAQPYVVAPTAELPALDGVRLLLVDDTIDTLNSFGTLLELEGAQVTACSSGIDALRAAEQADFDLILSDVGMPAMDGYELIAELRRRPRTAAVAAVALTGYGRPQDERRALDAGFDAHLSKPVVLDALIVAVTRLRRKVDSGGLR